MCVVLSSLPVICLVILPNALYDRCNITDEDADKMRLRIYHIIGGEPVLKS